MTAATQLAVSNEVRKAQAAKFFMKVADTVTSLYERWLDEKEYEDINDYKAPIEAIAKKFDVQILKMTKRPFGFQFRLHGAYYVVTHTTTALSYKRVTA